jgi:hypothetical protein
MHRSKCINAKVQEARKEELLRSHFKTLYNRVNLQ